MSPPIVFPQPFYQQLIANDIGSGARSIIEKNHNDVRLFNLPEAFVDIDTPEDLIKLNHWQQLNGYSAK
jgi:molybdenum cofactor cytidylyltransferase